MKKSKLIFGVFLTLLFYLGVYDSKTIQFADLKIYDYLRGFTNSQNENNSVVIVDIDEKSLASLGQWPWSRVVLANLVDRINSYNPSNIGLDILFPEEDKTSPKIFKQFYKTYFNMQLEIEGLPQSFDDNDNIFAQVLQKSSSTLPLYMETISPQNMQCYTPLKNRDLIFESNSFLEARGVLCNIDVLQKATKSVGFINAAQDVDGIFRRVPLFIKHSNTIYPNFALANILNVNDLHVNNGLISTLGSSFEMNEKSEVLLRFYDKYSTVSAIDVLTGEVGEEELKGKFVIIGASAIGLHDRYMIHSSQIISGATIHATLIENIINNVTIIQPEKYKNLHLFFSFFASVILVYILYKSAYFGLLVTFLALTLGSILSGVYWLNNGLYISSGYLLFPFVSHFFVLCVGFILIYYQERKQFYEELTKAHSSTIDSMALVAETRDTETGAHIKRTREYMILFGEYLYKNNIYKSQLSPKFRSLLYRATPLHDIGKVGIPDSILKKPGKLTDEEYEIMKNHATIGKEIIENAMQGNEQNDFLKIAYNIAYSHHEKWDGSGYPRGLKGEEIPLEARMMAICDVYDALISRRCYKIAFAFEESEKVIIEGASTHFDPRLVEVFIILKSQFKEVALRIKE